MYTKSAMWTWGGLTKQVRLCWQGCLPTLVWRAQVAAPFGSELQRHRATKRKQEAPLTIARSTAACQAVPAFDTTNFKRLTCILLNQKQPHAKVPPLCTSERVCLYPDGNCHAHAPLPPTTRTGYTGTLPPQHLQLPCGQICCPQDNLRPPPQRKSKHFTAP